MDLFTQQTTKYLTQFHITRSTHLLRLDLADETPVAEADDLTLDFDRDVVIRELERGILHYDDVVVRFQPLSTPLIFAAAAAALRTRGLPLLGHRGIARDVCCLGGPDTLRAAPLGRIERPLVFIGHLEPHLVGIVAGTGDLVAATVDPEVINAKTHTHPLWDFVGLLAFLAARAVAEVERDADLARDL